MSNTSTTSLAKDASIAPVQPEHIEDKEVLEAYYDDGSKDFIVRAPNNDYTRLNEGSLRRQLKQRGYCDVSPEKGALSEIQHRIAEIQMHHCVRYAAPLAGYNAGSIDVDGRLILVTESPRIIQPANGSCNVIHSFVENLLGDQVDYFWAWLKIAYTCLLTGKHRPGQALVIAGERDCGKSLLQKIITQVLGGRAAKPYSWMSGATDFNKHLFMAEHLVIDDEAASTNLQKRRTFGAYLKQVTGLLMQQCHGKHQTPLTLYPLWRLSISLNDEPENMLVLPPVDTSLEDKVILLKATRAALPMPTTSHEERERFWNTLVSELPALLYDLAEWEIPDELHGGRFGVRHYHHPDLIAALRELSPEMQLLSLIDEALFEGGDIKSPLAVRSEELAGKLRDSEYANEARQVLSFYRACGTYLGRLAKTHPHRIKAHREKGVSYWVIYSPSKPADVKANGAQVLTQNEH